MKHGGPYKTGDCVRSIKAIADKTGRVLYIAPYDGQKKRPRRAGITAESRAEQNVHDHYSKKGDKSQCQR